MDPYLRMALNNAWANETLINAAGALNPVAFLASRPGFYPSLAATLNHLYEVDLYYIDALEAGGLGRSVYDREMTTDAGTLATLQAEADARLIALCKTLNAPKLAEMRVTVRPEGVVEERVDALLLHLFQHQVHHRGQAHVQLQDAGVAPPQLDDFHLDHGRVPRATAILDGLG
jgi:uncharacterized damage-inducible protein DinB